MTHSSTQLASTSVLTRISSIDLMRGIVMVIMALDHVRDFFHAGAQTADPTNPETTTGLLFFTRFITHFCAPTFVLLAGAAICLSAEKKTKKELSLFLLTRGLWLMILEVTVMRFSFFFQLYYDVIFFQVIYAIGISMVVMAALIHLPAKSLPVIGFLLVVGNEALNLIPIANDSVWIIPASFAFKFNFIQATPDTALFIMYPFLPWLGIMLLGYALGSWYGKNYDAIIRRKQLRNYGLSAIALFIVLRGINSYGDPAHWSVQASSFKTFLSFMNVSKYPPSLAYASLMLGVVMVVMSYLETAKGKLVDALLVIGRVPLFYYILHFFVIHAAALALYLFRSGKSLNEIDFHLNATFGGIPAGEGVSLAWVYVAWILVVVAVYPLCRWYHQYKSSRRYKWMSYL